MNYYRRYVGDFQRDTGHLSLAEVGAYDRLLDAQYASEQPLPADIASLNRICRAMTEAEQTAVRTVVEQFFPLVEGGRSNPRARRELAIGVTAIEKMRDAGQVGARRRWGGDRVPHGVPHRVTDGVTGGVAIQPPSTIHHPPTTTPHPPTAIASSTGDGVQRVVGAHAARLHRTWTLPDEWGEWAIRDRKWDTAQVERTAAQFRDYWIAKAGRDARKVDWFATWRNWCRNEHRARGGNGAIGKQAGLEARNAEAGRKWLNDGAGKK